MIKKTSLGRKLEREKSYQQKNKPQIVKKTVIGSYTSIIILNVNGLNAPTKKHRLPGCMKNVHVSTSTYITLLDPSKLYVMILYCLG